MDESSNSTPSSEDLVECVKARLLKEGREARNLIAYSLPVKTFKTSRSSSSFSHHGASSIKATTPNKEVKKSGTSIPPLLRKPEKQRPRSASAGRNPQASLRARHWGFLFRNLEQAVGEIYQTCEDDDSVIECREAILMLERYTSDFYKLIDWFKLKWEYENTAPIERPTSLSWEIRTSSPGKPYHRDKKVTNIQSAKAFLQFEEVSTCSDEQVENIAKLPDKKSDHDAIEIITKSPPTVIVQDEGTCPPLTTEHLKENLESFNYKVENRLAMVHETDEAGNYSHSPESTLEVVHSVHQTPSKTVESNISNEIVQDHNDCISDSLESNALQDNQMKFITKDDPNPDLSPSFSESKLATIKEANSESICNNNESIQTSKSVLELFVDKPHMEGPANKEESKNKNSNSKMSFNSERLSQKDVISQHLDGNGCISCNMVEENEKIVFMDKQKFDYLTPCAEDAENKKDGNLLLVSSVSQNSKETVLQNETGVETSSATCPTIESQNSTNCQEKTPDSFSDSNVKSKSTVLVKPMVAKGGEPDLKKTSETYQSKVLHIKPVPQVNMNKASQVRQAYNQSRTPQKAPCSNTWKNTEQKGTAAKQQASSGRGFRRYGESKSSPPTRRKMQGSAKSSPCHHYGAKNTLERSNTSTTFTVPKSFVRSHTTLADSQISRKTYSSLTKTTQNPYGGDRSSSISSLASSSNASSSGQSWADKVRGGSISNRQPSESHLSLQEDVDDEGWEVVRRGRRSHSGSSASLNSMQPGGLKYTSQFSQQQAPKEFSMKNRYHQPTSAVSMPSLADKTPSNNSKTNAAEPSTPRQSSTEDGSNCTPPESLQWNSLNARKRSKSYNFSSPKEAKSKRGNEKRKAKIKKQDSGEHPKFSKEFKASFNYSSNDENSVSMDKHKKNISNNSKKNELKKDLLNGTTGEISDSLLTLGKKSQESIDNKHMDVQNSVDSPTSNMSGNHESKKEKSTQVNNVMDDSINEDPYQEKRVVGKRPRASSLTPSEGSESEVEEEEKIRTNAAALESATKEEIRLKQQIEEAEKRSFEVLQGVEQAEEEEEEEEEEGEEEVEEEEEEELDDDENNKEENNSEGEGQWTGDSLSSSKEGEDGSNPNMEPFYNYDPQFKKLSSLSWAEEMDALDSINFFRLPGRVFHIHEKLSSPSRKLPLSEKLRRHQEKLAKAQVLRGKLIQAKTEKLKDLFKKINDVNNDKGRLLLEKRTLFERKMERAEEKRKRHLQDIVNKAHDEDNKAREIAFINGLEAQIKLHDIMQQHQNHESRLADMAEERSRKQEEKAAKEAAAQERRKALEAERQARMTELCEKRRRRCERIDRRQAERREELLEQAREKARDREERLSALQQAQQAKESELVKKIQQKQEETARRHEENIEQIRQRALESSIMRYSRGCDDAPKLLRYETKKLCTLCSSLISSDVYLLSHLRGKQHQEALKDLYKGEVSNEETATYNLKHIVDAPTTIDDPQVTRDKERQKALKKRYRKIRTRMISRGREYLAGYHPPPIKETPNKARMSKSLQQITKLLNNQGTGPWPSADVNHLDRHMLEITRLLEKKTPSDKVTFAALDGFSKLSSFLGLITDAKDGESCVIPARSLGYCGKVLVSACHSSKDNCKLLLYSNISGNSVEQLLQRLVDLSGELVRIGSSSSLNMLPSLPSDPAAVALIELLSQILEVLKDSSRFCASEMSSKEKEDPEGIWQRLQDIISYCVSIGIVDKITWYFNHIQYPVENDAASSEFIMAAMRILASLANALIGRNLPGDPTQLVGTIHVTEACGVVSLLYGFLLHQGGRSSSPPPSNLLSSSTLAITAAATTLLQSLAELDLTMFQSILGSEGISLEFRHISSFLLWYCSHCPCEDVLHNIISLVGFFSVGNRENQMIIQSGESPSVLQQLCSLPWQYFSEPRLTSVLFPTLLSCCWQNPDNLQILVQEMSFQVLEDFLQSGRADDKPLVQIFRKKVLSHGKKR